MGIFQLWTHMTYCNETGSQNAVRERTTQCLCMFTISSELHWLKLYLFCGSRHKWVIAPYKIIVSLDFLLEPISASTRMQYWANTCTLCSSFESWSLNISSRKYTTAAAAAVAKNHTVSKRIAKRLIFYPSLECKNCSTQLCTELLILRKTISWWGRQKFAYLLSPSPRIAGDRSKISGQVCVWFYLINPEPVYLLVFGMDGLICVTCLTLRRADSKNLSMDTSIIYFLHSSSWFVTVWSIKQNTTWCHFYKNSDLRS